VIAFHPGAGATGVDQQSGDVLRSRHQSGHCRVALYVSLNGVLSPGATVAGNNRVAGSRHRFQFQRGALVAVWFTSAGPTPPATGYATTRPASRSPRPEAAGDGDFRVSLRLDFAHQHGDRRRTSKPIDPATVGEQPV
jgi:hypothetical protein